MFRRCCRLALALPAALMALAVGGCRAPASCLPRASAAMPAVRTAAYRQAQQAYARRDYRTALRTVDGLLASAPTPADRAFLTHQRDICRRALGLKPALSVPAASRSPASTARRGPALADCGPRALLLVCRRLGATTSLSELRRLSGTTADGTTLEGLAQVAKAKGLRASRTTPTTG